jgi:DNA polymerase/3'-5' exonuclease PolX
MSVSTDTRLFRPEAIAAAKAFIAEIEGAYDQLVVAGSLRRRLARISDVEIVAVPKTEQRAGGLFGDEATASDLLDERLNDLLDNDVVQQRLDVNGHPRWGPLVKYLTYRDVRVDLFCPAAGRFGWILMLRTGPAAFSRQLVVAKDRRTRDGRPGLRPVYIATQDGWLCWRTSGERIPTPTEQHVCDLYGMPYLEPQERT